MKAMKCFSFSHGDKNGEPKSTKSTSVRSPISMWNGQEGRRSGSEFMSMDISDISTESSTRISFTSLTQNPSGRSNNNLREFAFAELKAATRNFSRALMIGEGGFGGVYRAVIRDTDDSSKKIDVAVKQLSRRGLQGHKEWVTEVNVLGFVDHPNLVKLVGYCAVDDERGIQRLLVYEYMPNRSVQDHLCNRFRTPLPWSTRLKIAQDAARGLAYLHEGMEFQVVGTVGYAAPEYVQTGRLTYKSDVWSYGIFLYELITGRRPMDRNKPKNEQKLLEWVRPHLSRDLRKFEHILDPRLAGNYSLKSAQKLAAVANKCLLRQPRMRPKMSEVLEVVNKIVEDASVESLEESSPCFESVSRPKYGVCEKSIRSGLKRRLVDPIVGENKWLICLIGSPKVMSTR
ncbi:serine/threonine-protein kinase PCRK1-like isoform X2 [Cynara cardunculus var. scolymus]|uniref:serine/threonine-protein kinase PCRK1-like isoform X2 n=1 Tax=Cynara cardunculus var. scolymus TaxID=59895 RepID=UPI000D6305FE|nr:serine/threonine-protein kinase PCRK1-like isoform X2 [Cynara cardunculus var. scolymus]